MASLGEVRNCSLKLALVSRVGSSAVAVCAVGCSHEAAVRIYNGVKADGVSGLCRAQMSHSYFFSMDL